MLSWEEVLTNSEGTETPPTPRPVPWRFPAVGKCAKTLGVCPGRVQDRGAPEPSAGSLALGDLTKDLAGLGEQSKGGSPIRERRDTSALMAYRGTPA